MLYLPYGGERGEREKERWEKGEREKGKGGWVEVGSAEVGCMHLVEYRGVDS